MIQHETVASLLASVGLDAAHATPSLQVLADADSRFLKDLKLNIATVMGSSNMTAKEAALLALSVAVNEKHTHLIAAFTQKAEAVGASTAEIAEIHACTAIMTANNVFYRFRHYMSDVAYYNNQPAGLRMSSMMNPVIGKEFFELVSLAVSAINGCERCVTSHENSVKEHGASEARIYDAIRLAAVIKSACTVL